MAEGRIAQNEGELKLDEKELNITFNIDETRINIAGEIPPLRDTSGTFKLSGQRMEVGVKQGAAFFPSGRSVALNGGDFIIPDVYTKPLIAEMKIEVGGEADAIAELVTYKPIQALQKTPFVPGDFTGPLTAQVGARFGLVTDQHPPPPLWQVEMQLEDVTVTRPIAGRGVSNLSGTFRVDNEQAVLDADAVVEGAKVKIALTEPVDSKSKVKRKREISGTLDAAAREKLTPGLSKIIFGPMDVDLVIDEADVQHVTVDLTKARLSLPWIGWNKGAGIPAEVRFTSDINDSVTTIKDFAIAGDGFGARGNLQVDGAGIVNAKLSNVRLAQGDDFNVAIDRRKGIHVVTLSGAAADIRPILAQMKSGSNGDGGAGDDITIQGQLGRVAGFNGEVLSNVNLVYSERGQQIDDINLSAVTGSGQAVVARLAKSGADNILELTTGDAGSLARFADIYSNMRGGLLNMKLRDRGGRSWRGSIDIRKFQLVGEQRLQSMVSTPAGQDGRSLNQAVTPRYRRQHGAFRARFCPACPRPQRHSGRWRRSQGNRCRRDFPGNRARRQRHHGHDGHLHARLRLEPNFWRAAVDRRLARQWPRPWPARHHLQAQRPIQPAEADDQPAFDHRARRLPQHLRVSIKRPAQWPAFEICLGVRRLRRGEPGYASSCRATA